MIRLRCTSVVDGVFSNEVIIRIPGYTEPFVVPREWVNEEGVAVEVMLPTEYHKVVHVEVEDLR